MRRVRRSCSMCRCRYNGRKSLGPAGFTVPARDWRRGWPIAADRPVGRSRPAKRAKAGRRGGANACAASTGCPGPRCRSSAHAKPLPLRAAEYSCHQSSSMEAPILTLRGEARHEAAITANRASAMRNSTSENPACRSFRSWSMPHYPRLARGTSLKSPAGQPATSPLRWPCRAES